ncbi:hypothetical protein LLG96_08665 [bacterium]|nr:hypothetical protein [bacterium]
MENILNIKPHHFIDIITRYGEGTISEKPHPYGHALHLVSARILDNRRIILRIEPGADDICTPCLHNIDGKCNDTIDTSNRPQAPPSKNAWNLLIDRRWCERLEIGAGDIMSAQELCARIRDKAGNITDIYREIPEGLTRERERKLNDGIRKYLYE